MSKLIASIAALIVALSFAWTAWHGLTINHRGFPLPFEGVGYELTIHHEGSISHD